MQRRPPQGRPQADSLCPGAGVDRRAGAEGRRVWACWPSLSAEAGCWALLQRHPLARVLLTPSRAWRGRCALRTTDQIQELFPRCSAGPCGLSSTGTKSRCLRVVGPAWGDPVWSRQRSGLSVNRVVEGWCFHRLLFLPRLAPGLTLFPGRGIPSASFPQGRTSEPVGCLPAASP